MAMFGTLHLFEMTTCPRETRARQEGSLMIEKNVFGMRELGGYIRLSSDVVNLEGYLPYKTGALSSELEGEG